MKRPVAVLVSVLLLAACGEQSPPEPSDPDSPAPTGAEWSRTTLAGVSGADQPIVVASDDEAGVLVVATSEDGVLQAHASDDGTTFTAGEPLDTGEPYLVLADAVAGGDGWLVLATGGATERDGDTELAFAPLAFRSDDGLTWRQVDVAGIDAPVDLTSLVEVDGGYLAGGVVRPPGDADEGFRAGMWASQDGATWSAVDLPGAADRESNVTEVVGAGDRVLAAGTAGRGAALWASDDAGATWTRETGAPLDGAYAVHDVVADGVIVVMTLGSDTGSVFHRSTDGGITWQPVTSAPPASGDEGYAPVWAAGGRFFAITSVFLEALAQPEVCYADIDRCRQDSVVTLYASDDGDAWSRVDTSGIGTGEAGEVDAVTGTAGGAVVTARGEHEKGIAVASWPGGTPLPTEAEPDQAEVDLVEVPRSGPEVGVRYHAPLYLHCGMDHLSLGEDAWRRTDDGPGVETGAGGEPPADWPVAQQTLFGYATLVEPGVVEYSLEGGEVIATYGPAPRVSGCD